ncbi:MAG: radical SAM protein [Polyangiaceae bacterium]|nr:radical SAM protein [Polyangiaceae bacterium]
MPEPLDHRALYRLPWNLADNPIAWLEPTQACNLACDGCYRKNERNHKSIDEVQSELETFAKLRNFDGVSIAGGDPLCHPEVVEIVRRVTKMGRKAIINTNGLDLTPEMLRELKAAGLVGLTFHVDSRQGRPGWRNKTEQQMNELRSTYAEMVASVGGLSCAFNSTVYEDTLEQVPDVAEWAARNIDKVHTVVFITYRAAMLTDYDYFAGGERVDMGKLVYSTEQPRRIDISSRDVARVIRERDPDFRPAAYLNGTERPDSFKWLLALRAGTRGRIHGYLGPKLLEATQVAHHLFQGRYYAYSSPWALSFGRTILLGSLWEPGARAAAASYLRSVVADPREALNGVHLQAVLLIQPIDLLEDGRQNMCDGCPDMTLHDGKLVWSCRLEELRHFGRFLDSARKADAAQEQAAE